MNYRNEVEIACGALGEAASAHRQLGMLARFGDFLGWPDWFFEGTHLRKSAPAHHNTSTRDHLSIIANVLEHGFGPSLINLVCDPVRVPLSPSAALMIHKSPTLGDIFNVFDSYYSSSARFVNCKQVRAEGLRLLSFSERVPLGKLFDFLGAIEVIMFVRILERFSAQCEERWSARFLITQEMSSSKLIGFAGGTIESDARRIELAFPLKWELLANPDFDPSLQKLAIINQQSRRSRVTSVEVAQRIQLNVMMTLKNEHRVPRLKEIASMENLSLRTLNRVLSDTGAQYQEIVDSTRRSLISTMISDRSMPIRDIAEFTGFSDVSSFGRSFKSWFGESPSRFRERVLS